LSWTTSDDDLKKFFSPYGTVTGTKVIKEKETGKSKGYGFVSFKSEEEAMFAVKSSKGRELGGRQITIQLAKERPENTNKFANIDKKEQECVSVISSASYRDPLEMLNEDEKISNFDLIARSAEKIDFFELQRIFSQQNLVLPRRSDFSCDRVGGNVDKFYSNLNNFSARSNDDYLRENRSSHGSTSSIIYGYDKDRDFLRESRDYVPMYHDRTSEHRCINDSGRKRSRSPYDYRFNDKLSLTSYERVRERSGAFYDKRTRDRSPYYEKRIIDISPSLYESRIDRSPTMESRIRVRSPIYNGRSRFY
ncbi:hypothetical protein HK099_005505, partial [Clydaea vesicula]